MRSGSSSWNRGVIVGRRGNKFMKTKYRIRKRFDRFSVLRYMPQQLVKVLWWMYYENMRPGSGYFSEQEARAFIASHSASTPKPKTEYIYIP